MLSLPRSGSLICCFRYADGLSISGGREEEHLFKLVAEIVRIKTNRIGDLTDRQLRIFEQGLRMAQFASGDGLTGGAAHDIPAAAIEIALRYAERAELLDMNGLGKVRFQIIKKAAHQHMFTVAGNRRGKALLILLSENADEQQLEHRADLRISPRILFPKRGITSSDEREFIGGNEAWKGRN